MLLSYLSHHRQSDSLGMTLKTYTPTTPPPVRSKATVKRSIMLGRHKTSISLEGPFWEAVKEIAVEREVPTKQLVGEIDMSRKQSNLSSTIRLFVLDYYKSKAASVGGVDQKR
jgi:predicted DNA-binding ribbon-helix-helix protein